MLNQKGCSSVSILKIQQCLNQLIPDLCITEDGIYGPQTFEAVKAFQKTNGLKDDGCLNSMTWDKIILKFKMKKPPELSFVPSLKPLSYGSCGMDVFKAQYYLNLLLKDEPVEINGIFDAKTQLKVIRFQNKSGLNPDGRINLETWDKIIDSI